jgi:ribosome biogenesis GTPase / thiamine phosphate phosphatase
MSKRRITEQQARRIQQGQERVHAPDTGLVLAHFGKTVAVWDGARGTTVFCHKRQHLGQLVVGDEVFWQGSVVTKILPRRSCIEKVNAHGKRVPMAANIDQLVIVVALIPAPQQTIIDRYLVLAAHYGIQPILVFNKSDLMETAKAVWDNMLSIYQALPYTQFSTCTYDKASLTGLQLALQGQISLVVGPSGVGKSSLIQQLVQNDAIVIGDLSQEGRLGKHTTTVSRWYFLAEGGAIVDSPGVRTLKVPPLSRQQLLACFPEFAPYSGACRFRNCKHTEETPGCALWQAVAQQRISAARLQSFEAIALETM